jgi:DNA-binding transcriptional LysR family regulator
MASSPLLLHEWAKNGAGIALIPSWLVQDLRVLLPEWLTPPIAVHAIHRAEARGVPRIVAVIGALAEVPFGSVNMGSVKPAPTY